MAAPDTKEPVFVEMFGERHAVTMPDFATREEISVAWGAARSRKGVALLRVYAAVLGLCTRLGRRADADYAKSRFDILAYGGDVYSYLREKGVEAPQIAEAALPVITMVVEATYPRQVEVVAEVGNSEGGAAS